MTNPTPIVGMLAVPGVLAAPLTAAPRADADTTAYLSTVTARPGDNLAKADDALAYGHGICDKVDRGRTYRQVMSDLTTDFKTSDEYQASYLITQAMNEMCAAQIWQLRHTAAHDQPPSP